MSRADINRICDMSINEIALVLEHLYKDMDEIQGYIENEDYDSAKKQALDAMKMMESSVI